MQPPQWIGYNMEIVGPTYLGLSLQMARHPEIVTELDIIKVKSTVRHLKEYKG